MPQLHNVKTKNLCPSRYCLTAGGAVQWPQMLGAFIVWFISIFLYLFAPDEYSFKYCTLIVIVYLVSSIWIVRSTIINNNYFNFHVLFLISFFFVNFVYPIFLYPVSPTYFRVFEFSFNENIITQATALALIGSSSYILGVSIVLRKKYRCSAKLKKKFKTLQFLLSCFVWLMFVVILYFAGPEMIGGCFDASTNIPGVLLVIFQVGIGLAVILNATTKKYKGTILNFIRNFNKPILLLLSCYILLFLYTGDRGPAIQIVLILICSFSLFVSPIKIKSIITLVLVGMLALAFVGAARSKNINASEAGVSNFVSRGLGKIQFNSFFDIGMDLIINNRNLYVGYDYANKNGINNGRGMVRYIFAPIPLAPGLMTDLLFDSTPNRLSSGRIITDLSNASWGLGTNMIVDQYMEFGLVGVIFFSFMLGYIVMKFQIKAIYNRKFFFIIGYLFLVGFSVYLPRSTVMDPLRHVTWAIILFYLLEYFSRILCSLKGEALAKSQNEPFSDGN